MNLKTKIFVLVALSLFSVSLVTLPAATAFASDSFSQKVNDEYIWELKALPPGESVLFLQKVGDQLKIIITAANKTKSGPVLYDTLWGSWYNNSATNRTWQLWLTTTIITFYNSTYGWLLLFAWPLFIPHNVTAVNSTLYDGLGMGNNYTWTSGPHGYDGTVTAWTGPATGKLGMPKYQFQFNANGVMQYWKIYNGTGSGWTLIFDLELLGGGIPGFLASPLLLILSIFVAFQLLRTKKKPVPL